MMKTESVPEISVVMAIRNEERYIETALESICSQDGVSFEVLVVDDASTDKTWEIVSGLSQRWPCIRLGRNPGRGKVAAFNNGVAQSRGRFVCLFAGDDVMPPGSLAARREGTRPDSDDRAICSLSKIKTMSDDPRYDGHVVPRAKGRGNPSGQSPLMNRRMIEQLFPVPDNLPNEDTWLAIAFSHLPDLEIRHTDIICCNWRMHSGNTYNHTMPHAQFKQRMESRWHAHEIFYGKFADILSPNARLCLERQIRCNHAYARGSLWGVMFSGASLKDRLRALGTINPLFYGLRKRFYGLLSGW
jgi:glycosyltransferase involved in cell wall biosynthesis